MSNEFGNEGVTGRTGRETRSTYFKLTNVPSPHLTISRPSTTARPLWAWATVQREPYRQRRQRRTGWQRCGAGWQAAWGAIDGGSGVAAGDRAVEEEIGTASIR